ncbi:MAG TPA: GNAT family protein [Candidatus Limnocylindria bacterium]
MEFVRALELSGEAGIRYRHRGVSGSPEDFHRRMWMGVLHQVIAVDLVSNEKLGVLACFGADFRNGHAHIAFVFADTARSDGRSVDAVEQFFDYLFSTFPFRKLYGEVLEFNISQFSSAIGPIASVEGRKRAHEWHDGRHWDQLLLAIYREQWARWSQRIEGSLLQRLEEVIGPDGHHDPTASLGDLELDSLSSVELADLVETVVDSSFRDGDSLPGLTVSALAQLCEQHDSARQSP